MKQILVPTDFSPEADRALAAARDIALKTGAEIHFLHVIEPITGYGANLTGPTAGDEGLDSVFMLKLIERNKSLLSKRANSSELMNITTHMKIVVEEVYPAITNYVQDKGIDLIIMGSKGASGIKEVLVGSNAERVVRLSKVPVVVMKNEIPNFNVQNIVLATNGEEDSLALATAVKAFQTAFGSHIHILNVNTPNNFYRSRTIQAQLEAFAQRNGLSNYSIHVYNDSSEEDGIIYYADEINADLIAMGTHGRTGLSRVLSGSLAEEVVNHANRPVLTVKFA